MNFTARAWRASLVCSAIIISSGCVSTISTPTEVATAQTDAQEPTAAVAELATTPAPTSSAKILIPEGEGRIGVEIRQSDGSDTVVIGSTLTDSDFTISRYHAPERLVIDLFNHPSTLTKTFGVADSAILSKVRVGAHPDKSRIVLDITGGSTVQHEAALRDGRLEVTLAAGAVTATSSRADISQAAAEEVADQQAARPRLSSVQISNAPEGGNMVVADVSWPTQFGLKRTAPSEYVLTLKGTILDPASSTTLLAPAASGAVRSVRPVAQGEDVVLRVFVAPESSLSARVEGNKIILGQFAQVVRPEEMMAQLAPEQKGKSAAKAKAPEATTQLEPAALKEDTASAEGDKVAAILDETAKYSGRLISLDLQDTDIDNALRIIAEVSNLNIIASEDVTGKITLRLIDVPWDQALDVILKTNGLDKVQEGNVVRIAPVEKLRQEREALKQAQIAEQELEPLKVEYIRVSYAKASELKTLVESVLTERGSVAYDERTNQLIVKDISAGTKNVAKLVQKLDLRTPQILLETQIVEANRNLTRELGSQFGFNVVRSPQTGNATGYNFPNSVAIGGAAGAGGLASNFPASGGSAVSVALGSADGTININTILSAMETEGRGRVVSRPSVATTNNKLATIKAIKKIRIKLPSGALNVATGQGASNSGGQSATETVEIGITLDVTPQASPDYYVLMDLKAKSSTLDPGIVVDGIPAEVERSANSTVLVSSGQTFAMGGIYKITDDNSSQGVPFLKDVPVLGTLFRYSKVDNKDEELLFFVTPRIIEGSFDDAAMRAAS